MKIEYYVESAYYCIITIALLDVYTFIVISLASLWSSQYLGIIPYNYKLIDYELQPNYWDISAKLFGNKGYGYTSGGKRI